MSITAIVTGTTVTATATTGARDIMVVHVRDTIGRERTTIAIAIGTIGRTEEMIATPVSDSRRVIATVIEATVPMTAVVGIEIAVPVILAIIVTVAATAIVRQAIETVATPQIGANGIAPDPRIVMTYLSDPETPGHVPIRSDVEHEHLRT